jgi:Replication initiator protein A
LRRQIVRLTREGRMQEVEIKLSDWVFNAIKAKEVLTLHRDYFRLRKPLERCMYELAASIAASRPPGQSVWNCCKRNAAPTRRKKSSGVWCGLL